MFFINLLTLVHMDRQCLTLSVITYVMQNNVEIGIILDPELLALVNDLDHDEMVRLAFLYRRWADQLERLVNSGGPLSPDLRQALRTYEQLRQIWN